MHRGEIIIIGHCSCNEEGIKYFIRRNRLQLTFGKTLFMKIQAHL